MIFTKLKKFLYNQVPHIQTIIVDTNYAIIFVTQNYVQQINQEDECLCSMEVLPLPTTKEATRTRSDCVSGGCGYMTGKGGSAFWPDHNIYFLLCLDISLVLSLL